MRTFVFENVYLKNSYTLLSSLENKPTIKDDVDEVKDDYYCGDKSIEECESNLQKTTIEKLLNKTKFKNENIDLLISTDLQNQLFASNFSGSKFDIPLLGIYSACAGYVEGLIIASSLIDSNFINNSIVTASSHNLVSEKQFRYPIEYGAIKKNVNSFTVTGSVSSLITNLPGDIKIKSGTIGKVIDLGHTDSNDMGSAMAPSCAHVIYEHLKSLNISPSYYDLILTGDLGLYGSKILKDYYKKTFKEELSNVEDSGCLIYGVNEESDYAGGSGPACLPLLFNSTILKNKQFKKILLVATGSLHSVTSVGLNLSIPGISHAIGIEVKR